MGSGGPGGLTALSLLAAATLVAVTSAAAVKPAASSPAAASSEGEASGGGGMYMVPHLGNNPVLGPVTGAPPGKLTHVPLSALSVSVRSKDDSVTQRRLPEERTVIEPAGRDGDYDFHQRLVEAAERHPLQRKPRLDSSELSQFMLGSRPPQRKPRLDSSELSQFMLGSRPPQRKPRLDSSELSQFLFGNQPPNRQPQWRWHDYRQRLQELPKRPLHL